MTIISRLNLSTQIHTYVCMYSTLLTYLHMKIQHYYWYICLGNCYLATNVIKKFEINHEMNKVFRYKNCIVLTQVSTFW